MSCLILLSVLLSGRMEGGGNAARITVRNPVGIERKVETVGVSLRELENSGFRVEMDHLLVTDKRTGESLRYQIEEGTLLFQSDFGPLEEREFLVSQTSQAVAKVPSLVDGRFELPREDYAWENDRIAFRAYGPALAAEVNNGIDVWTKRVRYLIVDKWYTESAAAGKDTYHEDHGEGADFFSVGRSLGAGACGAWLNDSLYQPGVFSSSRSISNGPIRTTFELVYRDWHIGDKTLTEHMRVSLDAGSNLNRIELVFEGPSANDSLQLVCGLVKRSNTTVSKDGTGRWLALWGPTTDDTANGFLGTGIVISPLTFGQLMEDRNQYLVTGQARVGQPFVYYAGAGWSGNGDFSTEVDWTSYLHAFAERLLAPLEIKTHTY